MIEIKGNFLDTTNEVLYDALVCTTNFNLKRNGQLVMGAGIAKVFRDAFPGLADEWGDRIKLGHKHVLATLHYTHNELYAQYLVAFPTKHDWRENSDLLLIETSAKQLKIIADALDWQKVLMTKPGCGNGNLRWEQVKPRLERWLDNRFYVIDRV